MSYLIRDEVKEINQLQSIVKLSKLVYKEKWTKL